VTLSNGDQEHPCPECGEEMTVEEMLGHRLREHDLSVVEQLQDVPDSLGKESDGDSSSLPNYCRCDDIEEDVPCGYCIRKKRSDPEDVEQVSRVQNNLPTAAIVTKTDLDYGCVVDPSYDVRFEEGDELVRRSDVEERDQKIIEAIDEIRKECNMFSDGSIHSKLLALREEIAGVEKKTNGGDK